MSIQLLWDAIDAKMIELGFKYDGTRGDGFTNRKYTINVVTMDKTGLRSGIGSGKISIGRDLTISIQYKESPRDFKFIKKVLEEQEIIIGALYSIVNGFYFDSSEIIDGNGGIESIIKFVYSDYISVA